MIHVGSMSLYYYEKTKENKFELVFVFQDSCIVLLQKDGAGGYRYSRNKKGMLEKILAEKKWKGNPCCCNTATCTGAEQWKVAHAESPFVPATIQSHLSPFCMHELIYFLVKR